MVIDIASQHNTNTRLKVRDKVLVKDMKNEGRKGGKLDQPLTFSTDKKNKVCLQTSLCTATVVDQIL